MKDLWVTTKELSLIFGIAQQNVRKKAVVQHYTTRYVHGRGRGGRVLEYKLSSLPIEVQEMYCALHNLSLPNDTTDYIEYERKYTGKQKGKAAFRAGVVRRFWRSGKNAAAFVRDFNAENSDTQISEWQLRDWEQRYKASDHNLESLVDRRGENRTGTETVSPEAWQYFLELILTPQGRSVQLCYDLVIRKYPNEPSVRTFQRKWSEFPDIAKIKAGGSKDKFELQFASQYRDYDSIEHSNSMWCLDHHLSDVLVRNKRGKIVRLWMTAILDVKSRKVMSMVIRDGYPNKTAIKQGLRIAIERYGIPELIQTDNGKDYLSKDLDPNEENTLLSLLGISKSTALPKHGQSKPIERFFETLETRLGKRFYSYAGHNAKKRPDYLQKLNKKLEDDPNIMDMDEFIKLCNEWIENEYSETKHHGNGMNGKTPNEVYYSNCENIRRFDDKAKLAIICGERVSRKVRHDCIQLFEEYYYAKNGELTNYIGKTVTVVYTPENVDVLYVFDENFRQICTVSARTRSAFRTKTADDIHEVQKLRKTAKKIVREQMPKARLSITDTIIQNHKEEHDFQLKTESVEAVATETLEVIPAPNRKKKSSFALYNECVEAEKKKEVI